MEVRLDQIDNEPFRWSRARVVDAADLGDLDLVGLSEIAWSGQIERTETGHLLTAQYAYEQTLACPRCLGSAVAPVSGELELLILPASEQPMLGEHELDKKELGVTYAHDGTIDTTPLLREQLLLNVPMQPLCRVDCLGLCSVCGGNKNIKNCDCVTAEVDPRWAALAALQDAPTD